MSGLNQNNIFTSSIKIPQKIGTTGTINIPVKKFGTFSSSHNSPPINIPQKRIFGPSSTPISPAIQETSPVFSSVPKKATSVFSSVPQKVPALVLGFF